MNKIIIFPTDTVYGIGCSVYDSKSIDNIYKIKNRDKSKPLAVLCASLNQIKEIAYINEKVENLINKYLPGPLTIILPAKEDIKKSMQIDSVGVRIPNHLLALEILNKYGPLATTSVNESGEMAKNEYEDIYINYYHLVDYIYKPSNDATSNVASTVVMVTKDSLKLIREGSISFNEIISIYE